MVREWQADDEVFPHLRRERRALEYAEGLVGDLAKGSQITAYNVAMWLNAFAGIFPGYAVCDLTKDHLNSRAQRRIDGQRRVKYNILVKHEDSECQTTSTRFW